jgi:hypothetical protein
LEILAFVFGAVGHLFGVYLSFISKLSNRRFPGNSGRFGVEDFESYGVTTTAN